MLTFNLKKEWFEKIKSGEKTHEYRVMNDYWCKRISALFSKTAIKPYFNLQKKTFQKGMPASKYVFTKLATPYVCFACGYPSSECMDKRLYAKVISVVSCLNGKCTDLNIDDLVFDIEFELIEDAEL